MGSTNNVHTPERTCVGCGRRRFQRELVRCALVVDPRDPSARRAVVSRRAPGRGAWLCGPDCLPAARRRNGFRRAWRAEVAPELLDALATELAELNQRVAIGAPAARLTD